MQLQDTLTGMGRLSDGGVASRLTVRPLTRERIVIRLLLLALALTTVYALAHIDDGGTNLAQALSDTLANLRTIFLQPGGPHLSFFATGNYDDLHGLIDTLYAELLARDLEVGEGPVLINYLDDADEVAPPHQRAHVYLPLALD